MPRRIEVELTSSREDGTWTWRAAGARQPKGTLDGTLLYDEAKVGDVVRADAEFDVEGITIVEVLPPRGPKKQPELLEIIGKPLSDDQLVISTLAPKRRGEGRDRGERGERRPRRDRDRGPRPEGEGARPGGDGRRPRSNDASGEGRPRPERRPRSERPERPAVEAKPKPKRLRPGRQHRSAVIATLPEQERPIAEQVLRGGIPSVRQELEKQNKELAAQGQPTVKGEALVAVAERLLPALRTAEWRDRADAALASIDELDLRDLRSVVVAADNAARDDETRALASQLSEALSQRVETEHRSWLEEVGSTLREGRVVRALRLSSRPPKAGSPIPAELGSALATAAGEALSSEVTQERWATVLDAIAYSPVRQQITPAAVPAEPSDDLLTVVRKLASRVPEIARKFGVDPTEAPKRPRRPRKPKSEGTPAASQESGVKASESVEAKPQANEATPATAEVAPATEEAPTEPKEGAEAPAAPEAAQVEQVETPGEAEPNTPDSATPES